MRALPSPLFAVTDRHGHPRPLPETVRALLAGGVRWVWFRDRDLAPDARREMAARLAGLVREAGGVLSVGAAADLAAASGAGGVHLGGGADRATIAAARARVGAAGLVGVSAHALRDVEAARDGGADYVTLSPIFPTASKPGYGPALGLDAIAAAVRVGLPVVALGGIDAGTLPACRAAGAAGVAIMGGLMRADDPEVAARGMLETWRAPALSLPSEEGTELQDRRPPLPARGERPAGTSSCLREAKAQPQRR